jgi:signal transduction histidine kinase
MDSSAIRSSRADKRVISRGSGSPDAPRVHREDGGAVLRQAREAIARASVLVTENLPPEVAHIGAELATGHLSWLQDIAFAGETLSTDEHVTGATHVLRRRLLDGVRAELVRAWGLDLPSPAVMVEALQALERAEKSCVPALDQAFAAELVDRGGMDLVVEVAHDMRSPLTSILFLSEILHRGQNGLVDPVQKRQIGIIYSAALGLVALATDMIEMARVGTELAARNPIAFSINETLSAVRDLVRPMAEEKGIEYRISEISSGNRIGYPIPISRVLLNLSTNALKFTQQGHVEVSARPFGGTRLEFAVRDTGPGIPPHAMNTLFQPFRPEPSRESGYYFSGTGLGLAICRRLVTAMGSDLVIETGPEWGTRFSFVIDLPAAPSF